jgi:hemerythrin-like domain-containing protein
MLRNKNLIPLSHQHQHALALCVRIERASPVAAADLDAWQAEIEQLCKAEIEIHFAAEEQIVFPVANKLTGLNSLVDELLDDHVALRRNFRLAESRQMTANDLLLFSQRFAGHIRKEERRLFERMQQLMSTEELNALGSRLAQALMESDQSCAVPNPVTRLRSVRSGKFQNAP